MNTAEVSSGTQIPDTWAGPAWYKSSPAGGRLAKHECHATQTVDRHPGKTPHTDPVGISGVEI